MRVSIYQPGYFPSLHYFNRILSSDVFVLLDTAQYTRGVRSTNTAKIKGKDGYIINMTVPILHTGKRELLIDVKVDRGQQWQRKHLETFRHAYGKKDEWNKYVSGLDTFYGLRESSFCKICELSIRGSMGVIDGWKGNFVRASDLGISGKGSKWMLDICKRLGATEYLCGKPAYDNYLDIESFEKAGIKIMVQNWEAPKYKQQGDGFIKNLSILDLLFNVPEENRRALLV